jgi:uncharacterized membrane protein YfcA
MVEAQNARPVSRWAHRIADWRTFCRVLGAGLVVTGVGALIGRLIETGALSTMVGILLIGVFVWWIGCWPDD